MEPRGAALAEGAALGMHPHSVSPKTRAEGLLQGISVSKCFCSRPGSSSTPSRGSAKSELNKGPWKSAGDLLAFLLFVDNL